MQIDGEALDDGAVLEADVCIVGAGPVGLSVASELCDAASVLVVDSGRQGRHRASDRLSRGERRGYPVMPLDQSRVRAVGGSSLHWFRDEAGFRARPLDPIDFEWRAAVPDSGWPLERSELDDAYRRAQAILGLGAFDYDLARWVRDAPGPPLDLGDAPLQTVIFQLTSNRHFPEVAGRIAADPALRVLLGASVTTLETDRDRSTVRSARARTMNGRTVHLRAATFVLAGGGLENARLLLLNDLPPRSIESSGVVGRYFMDHLWVRAGLIEPADPSLLDRVDLYRRYRSGGVVVDGKLAPTPEVVRSEGLLNSSFFLDPIGMDEASEGVRSAFVLRDAVTYRPRIPRLARHVRSVGRDAIPIGRAILRRQLGRRPHPRFLNVIAMAEQAPNRDSRVTLGSSRDRFGQRVLRLDWRLQRRDLASIAAAAALIDDAFRHLGLGRMIRRLDPADPPLIHGCWHHMGTTRMADDPSCGVVDRECRVHGIANLYATGASTFPTGGYANPTLTAVALAIRLAARLRRDLHPPPRAEA